MPVYIIILIVILIAAVYIRSTGNALRVLMYHKVDAAKTDRLTVTQLQLQQQICWLIKKKYSIISFKDFKQLEESSFAKKDRYVVLTFDDAYENNLTYALPVLKEHNTKATIFIPTAFIGKENEWDKGSDKIMTALQLQQLPAHIIEFGLHTHTHASFKHCNDEVIQKEMQQSIETLQNNNIPFVPVFAYAYGAFPKQEPAQKNMFGIFSTLGIWYAVRIGNNINTLPLKNKFLVKRIDIRGTDPFFIFKMKILLGRVRL
jgi:peptidoglycan/xylan/chitin deacetylase (PgdA/CDA1 family)